MSKNKLQAKPPSRDGQSAFAPRQTVGPATLGALATVAMQVVDQLIAVQVAAQQHLIFLRAVGTPVPAALVTQPDGTLHELPRKPLREHVVEIARHVARLQPLLDHFETRLRANTFRAEEPGIVQAHFLACGVILANGVIQEHGCDETALCNALASNLSGDLAKLRSAVANEVAALLNGDAEFEQKIARSAHQRQAVGIAILRALAKAEPDGLPTQEDVALAVNHSNVTYVGKLLSGYKAARLVSHEKRGQPWRITQVGTDRLRDVRDLTY